jgi:hypothetical protein
VLFWNKATIKNDFHQGRVRNGSALDICYIFKQLATLKNLKYPYDIPS